MSHQDRREPLPEGYQFGDAGQCFERGDVLTLVVPAPPYPGPAHHLTVEDDGGRLAFEVKYPHCPRRGACRGREIEWDGKVPYCATCGANWISGVVFHPGARDFKVRLCGAWNVIEGETH